MAKKNAGKRFEEDFFKSAKKEMFIYRLRDPASSFNQNCNNCPHKVTRFSIKNICDFFAYKKGKLYLFELKSHKGKSIPFKAIVTSDKDKRLEDMVKANKWGISSYVIVNFRDCENQTYAISAYLVFDYIRWADRKSIPLEFISKHGYLIDNNLIRVRYSYDLSRF